ncbi:unnamed protein product [Prunus armeniaca]
MARCSIASHFLHSIVFDNDVLDDQYEDDLLARIEAAILANEGRTSRRRGSIEGRVVVPRNIARGGRNLYEDYFADPPVFPDHLFRRRNADGLLGLSSLQKITATLRMLAYGNAADNLDEYVSIGESTTLESLKRFVKEIVATFGDEYLRLPNTNDITRLLAIRDQRHFLGMLGSIDCMHWRWKNCPSAWQGSHNDINVLDQYSIFNELAGGHAPPVNYSINGNNYTMGYYLDDGIYPTWSTFVKTIPAPQGNKKKYFVAAQESVRKDVEYAFGVLQSHFAIVRGAARLWDQNTLKDIMIACIRMHNMVIEKEQHDERYCHQIHNFDRWEIPNIEPARECSLGLTQFIQSHIRIRDKQTHCRLQADLVEHMWQQHGGE